MAYPYEFQVSLLYIVISGQPSLHGVSGQPDLHGEFQDSLGYTVKLSQKNFFNFMCLSFFVCICTMCAVRWEPEGIRHSGTGVIEISRRHVGAGNLQPQDLCKSS